MTCKICNLLANPALLKGMRLFEDELCAAVLSRRPASICHIIVFPKKHYTILEQVPDSEVVHMFIICNKISRAMFEVLNIQGTNIFVQNGTAADQEDPHFSINVIARVQNDGLKLEWEPRKLSEEEMSTIELSYKQKTDGTVFSQENSKASEAKPEDKKQGEKKQDEGENYMVKYFNRLP